MQRAQKAAAESDPLRGLYEDGQPAPTPEGEEDSTVKERADALGVLIRAGVDPEDAAQRAGLDGIEFTGAIPVSLRPKVTDAAQLEDKA